MSLNVWFSLFLSKICICTKFEVSPRKDLLSAKGRFEIFLSEKLPGKYKFYHMQTDTGNGDNEERFIYKTKKREAFKKKMWNFLRFDLTPPPTATKPELGHFLKKKVFFPKNFLNPNIAGKWLSIWTPPFISPKFFFYQNDSECPKMDFIHQEGVVSKDRVKGSG